jgi:hypothetical protein
VDWGQGLRQLKAWLDENANDRTVRLGQFGLFPPEAYGIEFERVTDSDLLTGSRPGLYAISAHIVASTPAIAKRLRGSGAEWLRDSEPVAVVGHAYYVFDVPGTTGEPADSTPLGPEASMQGADSAGEPADDQDGSTLRLGRVDE